MMETLLEISGLTAEISVADGRVHPLNGVDLAVRAGESVGLVGESGSGKTMSVMVSLGLAPSNTTVTAGHAWFDGVDLIGLTARERSDILGKDIGLIFQDAAVALDPLMTVGRQIGEGLRRHDRALSNRAIRARTIECLREVGISAPQQRVEQFPHEFSGGMRQRAMIAIAMANRPKLLIADEPTTALDVTIQAQILELIRSVQRETGSSLLLVTHDLGVIAEMTSRVAVMYAGRVIEDASVDDIFHDSKHPYTRGLVGSLPRLDRQAKSLIAIPGTPPRLDVVGASCDFLPRCSRSQGRAACLARPALEPSGTGGHRAACHFSDEVVAEEFSGAVA